MYSMTLTTQPPYFEMYVSTMGSEPREHISAFEKMSLKPNVVQTHSGDNHDTYKLYFNSKVDVFKAGIVVLQKYVYHHDGQFCTYANCTLDLYHEPT